MRQFNKISTTIAVIFCSSALCAAEINFPQTPISMSTNSPANVLFVFDDSGSMDWQFIAAPHYEYCNYFNPNNYPFCKTTLHNDAHFHYSNPKNNALESLEFRYIFAFNNAYTSIRTIDYPIIFDTDWRVFDSSFNKMFYNPGVLYTPWKGPCNGDGSIISSDTTCRPADIHNIATHPKSGHPKNSTTFDITNHYHDGNRFYHRWVVSIDDKKFDGAIPTPSNITDGSNEMIEPWDTHAQFSIIDAASIKLEIFKTDIGQQMTKSEEIVLTGNRCYNILGERALVESILANNSNRKARNAEGCMRVKDAIQNYANWTQYYLRRDFAAKAALSQIVDMFPNNHFGISFLNLDNNKIKYPISSSEEDLKIYNNQLLHKFFTHEQKPVGTPLVTALDTAGKYYSGDLNIPSPITSACQTNNAVVLTDGHWKEWSLPRHGDVDGDGYGSSGSSLSDVARHYYLKDLAPGIVGNTILNPIQSSGLPIPRPKSMATYGVSFGVVGNLIKGDDGWPTPALGVSSNWGNPNCSGGSKTCPEKIDDLWHASFNSGGGFVQANNIEELRNGLERTLSSIAMKSNSSYGGVAASTRLLTDDSLIFQASFDAQGWLGNIVANQIDATGLISTTPTWEAKNTLAQFNQAKRPVYTHNGKKGILYNWPAKFRDPNNEELSEMQINTVLKNVSSKKNFYGKNFIKYIKGHRNNEIQNNGIFRDREHILADIIYSGPLYIGAPNRQYTDASYLSFKQANSARTPMLAVGSNDGMLHILNATNGQELLAYVPGYEPMWDNLVSYSSPNYEHKFMVDGTPIADDYYSDKHNSWRTILTGSLGRGGQAIYGLNITNATFPNTESDAKDNVLFEFSDKDDPDLGYIIGSPQVLKMSNEKWAVVIGNGINNQSNRYSSGETDTSISESGQAALFILFFDKVYDGKWELDKDYIKILVGNGNQNGLSEPFAADIDKDGVADYIYAGDLNGEVWRFDVRDDDPKNWKNNVHKLYSTSDNPGSGLQPIIQAPVVGPHPEGIDKGVMVYFGTGKYLEESDASQENKYTQAIYGIWDKLNSSYTSGTSGLLEQKIIAQSGKLRSVSDNKIDWSIHKGWVLSLETPTTQTDGTTSYQNLGEIITARPILRNGKIILVTTVPPNVNENECSITNAQSWIMEVSSKNGGRLNYAVFDANGDGQFNSGDYINYTNNGETISIPHAGIKSDSGESHAPPLVLTTPDGTGEVKISSGSNGVSNESENPGPQSQGRQSWQEVY
jgi:type IV pilus assembly protein PilY1